MKISSVLNLLIFLILLGCQSESKYEGPSPVDRLIRDLMDEKTFSIILYDMQLDEGKNLYQHKYRIKTDIEDSTVQAKTTDWTDVSENFFAENLDNMGLELASKSSDGQIHKIPSPPGFNTAVGNPKYGQWHNDGYGNSFWVFYGQYAFMRSLFNLAYGPPVYHSTYVDYTQYRNNPNTGGQPYYGRGRNVYGTNSPTTKVSNPNFFQRKLQQRSLSSFKQKVASNPARYTRKNTLIGRSNSRTGYSSRARGSRFGK